MVAGDRPVELLLGNEAVGLAALHEGIGGAFSYPGTPATEIFEYIEATCPPELANAVRWSSNEKVAYEEALGMSYVGKRAIVSMKHVGLNVAADPFMNSALTGVNGGVVLVVADDPGMHSSQNEQDSRWFADFAHVPVLEPYDQQQVYDMTRDAFHVSERFDVPVLVRLVTRVSHTRGVVVARPPSKPKPDGTIQDWRKWNLLPPNARRRFARLVDVQASLRRHSNESPFNSLQIRGHDGIIATGLAASYVSEALGDNRDYSRLVIGAYPIPDELIRRMVDHCRRVFVFEEGYPYVERLLRGLLGMSGVDIHGKMSGEIPATGELTTEAVRSALFGDEAIKPSVDVGIPARPPRLCDGCPHCDAFMSLMEALRDWEAPKMFGDIGCYTLGVLPPYNAVGTCVDMGSSISMGVGAAKAGAYPVICTIGDSTFTHSGMTGLIDAAQMDADMTVLILDNSTVGMTGGQSAYATGDALNRIVAALGVNENNISNLKPTRSHFDENVVAIKSAIRHRGLSVLIASRPCIQAQRRQASSKQPVSAAR